MRQTQITFPVDLTHHERGFTASISHPNGQFQGVCEGESMEEVHHALSELVKAMIAYTVSAGEKIPPIHSFTAQNHSIDVAIDSALLS